MRAFGDSLVAFFAAMLVLAAASVMAGRFGLSYDSLLILFTGLVLASVVVLSGLSFTMLVPQFQRAGAGGSVAGRAAALACVSGGLLILGYPHAGHPAVPAAVVVAGLLATALVASVPGAGRGGPLADALEQRFATRLPVALVMLLLVPVYAGLGWALADVAVRQVAGAAGLSPPLVRGGLVLLLFVTVLPGGFAGPLILAPLIVLWVLAALALPVIAGGATIWADGGLALAPILEAALEGTVTPVGVVSGLLAVSGFLIALDLAPAGQGAAPARRAPVIAAAFLAGLVGLHVLSGALVELRTRQLAGQTPEALAAMVDDSHREAGLAVCGADRLDGTGLRRRCAARLVNGTIPASEITISDRAGGLWRAAILSLPQVAGVLYDLSLPLVMLIALAILVHRTAALLVHEGIYRLSGRGGTASGRLALQRTVAAGLAVAVAALPPPWGDAGAAGVLAAGLYILAAVPLPLALLSLWPRADIRAALCGLTAAALVAGGIISGHVPVQLGPVAGCLAAIGAGALAALLFPARRQADAAAPPAPPAPVEAAGGSSAA